MIRDVLVKCGSIGWPLGIVSIAVYGLLLGKFIATLLPGRFEKRVYDYTALVEPLAGIAVSLGLLGTVSGFISAFRAWTTKFEPMVLISGIYEAFYTTMVGLILSITAMASIYAFNACARKAGEGQ